MNTDYPDVTPGSIMARKAREAHQKKFRVVHFMQYGQTPCQKPGVPGDWEDGHGWSDDWEHVNCLSCRKGRELIDTFTISEDGKSITCKRCKMTSFNANDVAQHYCGKCHVHHDDIWPPARRWWIDQSPEVNPVERLQALNCKKCGLNAVTSALYLIDGNPAATECPAGGAHEFC